jgi:hypothetical protein
LHEASESDDVGVTFGKLDDDRTAARMPEQMHPVEAESP